MNELTYVIISHSFLKITVVLRAKISAFEVENVIILVKSDGIWGIGAKTFSGRDSSRLRSWTTGELKLKSSLEEEYVKC